MLTHGLLLWLVLIAYILARFAHEALLFVAGAKPTLTISLAHLTALLFVFLVLSVKEGGEHSHGFAFTTVRKNALGIVLLSFGCVGHLQGTTRLSLIQIVTGGLSIP